MTKLKRAICLIVFVSMTQLIMTTSLGEQSAWDCPECGRTGNTGNYCGGCAHPAPWISSTSTSTVNTLESMSEKDREAYITEQLTKYGIPQPTTEEELEIALQMLPELRGYLYLENPGTVSIWNGDPTTIGTYITFGHYEQDNDLTNGSEPIEWLVIKHDATNNKSLLISRYGLDVHVFDTSHMIPADKSSYPAGEVNMYPGWAESDIRSWLNDKFYKDAFSDNEQLAIIDTTVKTEDVTITNRASWEPEKADGGNDTVDKLFLLSVDEVSTYFKSDRERQCVPTKYAEKQGTNRYNGTDAVDGFCIWWLRSPYSSAIRFASDITPQGHFGGGSVNNDFAAVRPVLWLNLEPAYD